MISGKIKKGGCAGVIYILLHFRWGQLGDKYAYLLFCMRNVKL